MNEVKDMEKRPLFAYFGHHKCASTWIEKICNAACHDLRLRFKILYNEKVFARNLEDYLDKERLQFIAYANADYRYVAQLGDLRAFHVVRDPRDVLVSAYFSHRRSHPTHAWPELIDHRKALQRCSPEEGLLLEMEFSRVHFEEMRSWAGANNRNILDLKMEELTADPYFFIPKIFRFLGLVDEGELTPAKRMRYLRSKAAGKLEKRTGIRIPNAVQQLPMERLLGIIWENSFERLSGGRKPGQEDSANHYRKGVAGDWKNHFKPVHVREFKRRYNDILLQYGYEADPDWTMEAPQRWWASGLRRLWGAKGKRNGCPA
jgi:hypothetical protein